MMIHAFLSRFYGNYFELLKNYFHNKISLQNAVIRKKQQFFDKDWQQQQIDAIKQKVYCVTRQSILHQEKKSIKISRNR